MLSPFTIWWPDIGHDGSGAIVSNFLPEYPSWLYEQMTRQSRRSRVDVDCICREALLKSSLIWSLWDSPYFLRVLCFAPIAVGYPGLAVRDRSTATDK
jgi:hypothetical protein